MSQSSIKPSAYLPAAPATGSDFDSNTEIFWVTSAHAGWGLSHGFGGKLYVTWDMPERKWVSKGVQVAAKVPAKKNKKTKPPPQSFGLSLEPMTRFHHHWPWNASHAVLTKCLLGHVFVLCLHVLFLAFHAYQFLGMVTVPPCPPPGIAGK